MAAGGLYGRMLVFEGGGARSCIQPFRPFPLLYSLAGAATGFGATLKRAAEGKITLKQATADIAKRSMDSAASGKFQSGRRRQWAALRGVSGRF